MKMMSILITVFYLEAADARPPLEVKGRDDDTGDEERPLAFVSTGLFANIAFFSGESSPKGSSFI